MFNSLWGNKPYRATDMPLETETEGTETQQDVQTGKDEAIQQKEKHQESGNVSEDHTEPIGITEETLASWWNYTASYTNKLKESAQSYSKISAAKIGETVSKESVTNATNNLGSYFNSMYNGIKTSVESMQKEGIPEGMVPNINLGDMGITDIPMLSEFEVEQQKFMKMQQRRQGAAVPPWVGYNEEEKMKKQILSLSMDERNVLREPPAGVDFDFDLESNMPVAWAMLDTDSKLNDLRFKLVPKVIKEDKFWRNYFYRVSLIKQSSQLATLEKTMKTDVVASESDDFSFSPPAQDEFISDHLSDYEETQKLSLNEDELKQIGLQKDKEVKQQDEQEEQDKEQEQDKQEDDEWEAELARELQDFDMVEDVNGGLENETFEAELAEMLEHQ